MLNDSIGGTEGVVAKREEAWRIVPSPPKVAVTSTFPLRREDELFAIVPEDCGKVYRGKGTRGWSSCADEASRIKEMDG